MELIDLVNFVTIFLSQTTFLRCLTFPTRIPDRNSHSPTLLAYFVLLMLVCSTMAFPPLGNFDPVVVSVSIICTRLHRQTWAMSNFQIQFQKKKTSYLELCQLSTMGPFYLFLKNEKETLVALKSLELVSVGSRWWNDFHCFGFVSWCYNNDLLF